MTWEKGNGAEKATDGEQESIDRYLQREVDSCQNLDQEEGELDVSRKSQGWRGVNREVEARWGK